MMIIFLGLPMSIDEVMREAQSDGSWGSRPGVILAHDVMFYVGSEAKQRKKLGLLRLVDSYDEHYLKVDYVNSGMASRS